MLHTGIHVYNVDLPSGYVTDLGPTGIQSHSFPYNTWAYWGIAEYVGGSIYLLYAQNSYPSVTNIVRVQMPQGSQSVAANFQNFSQLSAFTFSPSLSRWFFHYPNTGQLGGGNSTLGSAKALFTTSPDLPYVVTQPFSLAAYPHSNVMFTAEAGGTPPLYYQWQFNGTNIAGATNTTLVLTDLPVESAGTYRMMVSNIAGTFFSEDATLYLVTSPVIYSSPSPRAVYPGDSVSFGGFADGAPPLYYQWLFNGQPISGATNQVLALTNVTPDASGDYSLEITNIYGSATTDPATLFVKAVPFFTTPPSNQVANAGDNATFTVVADGNPPIYYEWQFNGDDIPGATNASLTLTNLQPEQAGDYTILLRNSYGAFSTEAFLIVTTVPRIIADPKDTLGILGQSAKMSVLADGPQPLSYQWRYKGIDIPGATNSVLVLDNVQTNQAGPYSVRVINSYGSILSATANLQVPVLYPEGSSFRILSLSSANAHLVDHDALTGDDRAGIGASLFNIFITGDNHTARFGLDLVNGTSLSNIYDSIVGNLRTGTLYLMANKNGRPTPSDTTSEGVISQLLELDPYTGLTNGNQITLSSPIAIGGSYGTTTNQAGVFSGYDRIVLHTRTNVFSIALPSGQVTNLGAMAIPTHYPPESWAYWGVAEYYQGSVWLVYVVNNRTIARTRVPDGSTSTLASFSNLGDMANITMALYSNRWYFHYENSAQFGGTAETLGYASASFEVNPINHLEFAPIPSPQVAGSPFNVTVTAKNENNKPQTQFNGPLNLFGLAGSGQISITPTSINFTNGVWSGQVTVLQPSTNMFLKVTNNFLSSGVSSNFTVLFANDLILSVSDSPRPVAAGTPVTYLIGVTNTGPSPAIDVLIEHDLPPNLNILSATPSQGDCTIYTNAIICRLGRIDGSNTASIAVVGVPMVLGKYTNQISMYRSEADANLLNNSVTLVTTSTLPIITISDASIVEGNAGTTNLMNFTISLFPASTNIVQVSYTLGNVTAQNGSDFVFANDTLTFNPGQTTFVLPVAIIGDNLNEADETFAVQLYAPVNSFIGRPTAIGTILNDDATPGISVRDASLVEGNSGTNNMSFQVVLQARSGLPVTATYTNCDGTAVNGQDYLKRTGTITFAANTGILTQIVQVPILGDTLIESNEVFYVDLLSASNAIITRSRATGTIINDDGIGTLHHFSWAPIASPQMLSNDVSVSVTARDYFEATVTNFNGPVSLSGQLARQLLTTNILGESTNVFVYNGDYTLGYSITPNSDMTVTAVRYYVGTKVSIWTEDGTLLVSVPVGGDSQSWQQTPLASPLLLKAGVTYRISYYSGAGDYAYLDTTQSDFANGTIDGYYYMPGDGFPDQPTGAVLWALNLVYSFFPVTTSLPISRSASGTFVNGVWNGSVGFLIATNNAQLLANDGMGHEGTSNPFDVIALQIKNVWLNGIDVHLLFSGRAGQHYQVQRAHTVPSTSWSLVSDISVGADTDVEVLDSGAAVGAGYFYRLVLLP